MIQKNKLNLITILMCILPLLFQLSSITRNPKIYKVGYLLIVILHLLKNKGILISKTIFRFILIVTLVYLIFPLLTFNIKLDTILYFIFIVIFILASYIGGRILKVNKDSVIKGMLISNGVPLLIQIFYNIGQININTITSVITGDRFNRAIFGYSHSNFVAMFIVLEILLIYLKGNGGKRKIIDVFLMISFSLPLLATGSRTAVYSLIVFMILQISFKLSFKFKKYTKVIYFIIVISISASFIVNYGDEFILNSSGRNVQLINNFNIMLESNQLLFGAGGGSTSNINDINGIRYSDNWYMTTIINTGIVGFVIISCWIIYFFIKIYNNKFNDKFGISIFIMMFFYSFAENVLFVPGVVLSWFLWTYLMYIIQND